VPTRYNPKTLQFVAGNNRPLSQQAVSREVEKAVTRAQLDLRNLGRRLSAGEITLPDFQVAQRDQLKALHMLTASVAKGGRERMTQSDWGKAGQKLKVQYAYANQFAREIEQGKISKLQLEYRSGLYAAPARLTYYNTQLDEAKKVGMGECRRVVHSFEGCSACREWAAKGWMSIDDMPPIGTLLCRHFCLCTIEYRMPAAPAPEPPAATEIPDAVINDLVARTAAHIKDVGAFDENVYIDFTAPTLGSARPAAELRQIFGAPIRTEQLYGRRRASIPDGLRLQMNKYSGKESDIIGFKEAPVTSLMIKDLEVSQNFIFVNPLKESDGSKVINVWQFEGKNYFRDGNHTVAKRYLLGKDSVPVRIFKVK
jgi:hypothetical protein